METEGLGWSVEQLLQMHLGFAPARVLTTALELDVFSHLAAGKTSAGEVAQAAGATERGTRMVLDALAGIGLLGKNGKGYELTEVAEQFLVRGSPAYLGDFLTLDRIWKSWSGLTETVRTGKPYSCVECQEEAEKFFPKLIRGLHVVNAEPARLTAEALHVGTRRRGLRVLDVACGSGVWGIAIAQADPEARVTAQDFPAVLEVTRQFLKRHGVENRYSFLPGNLKETDFGEARFDLATLGHIVHTEGERSSRDLFRRVFRALRSGGEIAIADMIPNDERTGPAFPLIFALNMLVNTEAGDTFTFAEYERWLKGAGFTRVEAVDIHSHSPLIVGHKE
jgi:ubiquinone/menaquinone biosynthesis C-methylase UbiE